MKFETLNILQKPSILLGTDLSSKLSSLLHTAHSFSTIVVVTDTNLVNCGHLSTLMSALKDPGNGYKEATRVLSFAILVISKASFV
jgi:alcohol dehydrogenase class IV